MGLASIRIMAATRPFARSILTFAAGLMSGLGACTFGPGDDPGATPSADAGIGFDAACDGCGSRPEPPGGVGWHTAHASLKAKRFSITAGAERYYGRVADPHVSGDWVDASYTTLEVTWVELGVEMRLFIYLHSDGKEWWADEIRTYDGSASGDWIIYTGDFFRTPVGQAWTGDLDLATPPGASTPPGHLHLGGALLRGFLPPRCTGAAYSLEPWALHVETTVSQNGGSYVLPVSVRDAACQLIAPPQGASFEWTVDDTAVSTVRGDFDRGEFYGVALGQTTAHVRLRAPGGALLAESSFPVIVSTWP
jgi:hypothetical protein